MTNIVVKIYTVWYMGVEVIICQSGMSPERLMVSQTPSIGGHKIKTLSTQNRIFQTFQNCGILDLPHVCICQYNKYGSE